MEEKELHPSDQDLLLAADGEVSPRRARQIRAHLEACWLCRTRSREIEHAIAEFVHLYRGALDGQLPPAVGARALLTARMGQMEPERHTGLWPRCLQFISSQRPLAYVCAALFIAALGTRLLFPNFRPLSLQLPRISLESTTIPNPRLTPGATRPVTMNAVCSISREEVVRAVPASLRRRVLQEYGIANAPVQDYEIDYLIAPGLGGADDLRNLWPQPYKSTWNAHVKDALEEHLHELVCERKVDLGTAQRDIATDWIAAYKKYFHADKPLGAPLNSTLSKRSTADAALSSQFCRSCLGAEATGKPTRDPGPGPAT